MREINDYSKVFETLVEKTAKYLTENNLKAMILGISGGIDSTVCAAVCHEVSRRTGIPLIGRSLPTHFNKKNETDSATLVGQAFCDDFREMPINDTYVRFSENLIKYEKSAQTNIANGNIQARIRMIYLYNLASIHKGLVIDTDNLTEHYLGYFTIHGDQGDFNPIGGLWKTEVFKLAEWISKYYWKINMDYLKDEDFNKNDPRNTTGSQAIAIAKSLELKPTAGLGITSNDLEEIGAESYEQVDGILQEILAWKWDCKLMDRKFDSAKDEKDAFLEEQQMLCYPIEVIMAVTDRYFASEFKRKKLPIVIDRDLYTGYNEELKDTTYPYIKKHPELDNLYALFTRPNYGHIIESADMVGISPATVLKEPAFV